MLISKLFNPLSMLSHGIVKHTQETDCVLDHFVKLRLKVSLYMKVLSLTECRKKYFS